MKTLAILRSVLAIFVIAGLIAGPLAAPAAGGAPEAAPMVGMADDMPCCPHKPPPVECPKCAFMVVCSMLQCLPGLSGSMVLGRLAPTAARLLLASSDLHREGLGYPPPPRPPRSLILSA